MKIFKNRRKEAYEKCISLVSDEIYCYAHLINSFEEDVNRYIKDGLYSNVSRFSRDIEEMKEVLRVLNSLKRNMEYCMNEGD